MTIVIIVISEFIMALITLYSMSMLGEEISGVNHIRLIILFLCVIAVGVCFKTMFPTLPTALKIIAFLLNYFKFVLLETILFKKIKISMICLVLILNSLCSLCADGISFIFPTEQDAVTFQSELSLLFVRFIIMSLLFLFKRKSQKNYFNNVLTILPSYIYILVLTNLFLAEGLITAVNYEFPSVHAKDMIVTALAVALSLCVLATLVSLLLSVVSKEYYSDINKLLEKQIAIQISYYEDREKTYAEIRRFKHDYTNHIKCIRSLLKAERYDEILEYLGNITAMFPADRMSFNTGNFISDAILSDKQNSIKEENITIQFDGTIPSLINETDLCIILGNAIDNAIEASRLLNGKKTISVYGGFDHSYFILTVTNPTVNYEKNNGFLPFTTKTNKSEHGFGLLNIKSVVDKYNGYMKIENKDNIFTLSLTFNSIISECAHS